jgi:predicted nucleic acid-binding protein
MIRSADTSFLLSFYGSDVNTAAALRHVQQHQVPLLIHEVSSLEFENAVRLREFRGKLSAHEASRITSGFQADISAGRVVMVALPLPQIFQTASRLSALHTRALGNRAYDILQVAAALVAGADELLSFDARQRQLANAAGLRVGP